MANGEKDFTIIKPYEDTCKSCGACITWVSHEISKRPVPLDCRASLTGNILLVFTPEGTVYRIVKNTEDYGDDVQFFVNHFATCPDAKLYRKAKGK